MLIINSCENLFHVNFQVGILKFMNHAIGKFWELKIVFLVCNVFRGSKMRDTLEILVERSSIYDMQTVGFSLTEMVGHFQALENNCYPLNTR